VDFLNNGPLPPATLILGGARSGKSALGERLIEARGPGLYLATAEVLDGEMAERVRQHKARRGDQWQLLEEPLDLAGALRNHARTDRPVLVDCLTLWLSNIMTEQRDPEAEGAALAAALDGLAGPVILIANEVGLGIVPDNAMARHFRDLAGSAHQRLAEICDGVYFVIAGLPMTLKGDPPQDGELRGSVHEA